MAFSKPCTQRELDYIRENWRTKSTKEMAAELGRSERTVRKKINDMHLREEDAEQPTARRILVPPPVGAASEAHSLEELRDVIWRSLMEAEPRDVPRLAKEYRDTLAAIEAREAGRADEDDLGTDPIAERLRIVAGG